MFKLNQKVKVNKRGPLWWQGYEGRITKILERDPNKGIDFDYCVEINGNGICFMEYELDELL
jgi:hypothetical protein